MVHGKWILHEGNRKWVFSLSCASVTERQKNQRNHHLKADPSVCVWELGSPRSKFEGTWLWVKHSKPCSPGEHLWAECRECNAVEGQGNGAVCSPSRGQTLPWGRLRVEKVFSTCSEGGPGAFMPNFSLLHRLPHRAHPQMRPPQVQFLKRAERYTTSLRKIDVSRGNKWFTAQSWLDQARKAPPASAQQGDSIPRPADCSTELTYFRTSSRNLVPPLRQELGEIWMQLSPNDSQ